MGSGWVETPETGTGESCEVSAADIIAHVREILVEGSQGGPQPPIGSGPQRGPVSPHLPGGSGLPSPSQVS